MSHWTTEEELFLRKHYGKLSYKEMGDRLGRSELAVKYHAHGMGLPWPKTYSANNARDNAYMEKIRREING